jgi:hypothetical protein
MKIDRVILSLDNNPVYTPFWNLVSKIWRTKFNIIPTLIFNGTINEFDENKFDKNFGEIILIDKVNEVSESKPDWSVTWSLFWGAAQFENEVCMLCGIDQVPIGDYFFKSISTIENDKFVVGFADAYEKYDKNTLGYFNTVSNVLYPSSHLIGTGIKFREIFDINKNWVEEIKKVYTSRVNYHLRNNFYPNKLWGLDECYSSEKISTYDSQSNIIYLKLFWDYFYPNRIDLSGNVNSNFDIELVKNGFYSELTCKDFLSHKTKIDLIINNIPNINS